MIEIVIQIQESAKVTDHCEMGLRCLARPGHTPAEERMTNRLRAAITAELECVMLEDSTQGVMGTLVETVSPPSR